MSIYYVYAYLRSKDSTIASKGTPYYIGKGSNGRAYSKQHGSINLPPDRSNIVFLESNLSENKAFEIEKFLIAHHGRKDQGTGILRNRTDGGEGTSGMVHSEEAKAKMSAANVGKSHSEETKKKISTAQNGKQHSEKSKAKISTYQNNLPIMECPHCGKQGKGGAMIQWHFDNCPFVGANNIAYGA